MSRGGYRFGAGRPGWHAKTAAALRLDVRKLHRDGHLSGHNRMTWRWSNGATVGMDTAPDAVTLSYRYKFSDGWRDISQRVNLERTSCNYGGERPWFRCPRCCGRVAILYLRGWPGCRKCSRLVYPSQSDDAIARSWGRTYRIMRRLGQACDGYAVPRRPKGMRRATFDRLWEAWCREEKLRDEALMLFMEARGWSL